MSRSMHALQGEPLPYNHHLHQFLTFLKHERGFADATIVNRERSLKPFLAWLVAQDVPLSTVSPVVITKYFISAVAGKWRRTTVSFHVQSLRSFFRYASSRGWCGAGIAESIDAPRLYTYENLPQGPSWEEVGKLLASVNGTSPVQIRSRCAILLCAVYGLRVGEVCGLRLEDIDWAEEKISVRRSKQRKVQTYPLTTEVGNALLRYLKKARPRCAQREVFATLRRPYRPVSVGAVSTMTQKIQKKLGLKLKRYGSHVLRHACATHLLAQGLTLKEVGDHLGHVSVAATRIYAKVDLVGLREVAALDVRPLVDCIQQCEQSATPFYRIGEIQALRDVGQPRAGRCSMKIADALHEFILYKQSLGMTYKNRALKLTAFARFAGPVEIDSISPESVRRFLDGDRPVTAEWFNKFSALKMFFRFALSRGYATRNPLPISQPKSPRQFRPYIYSVEEVQKMIRVVDNRHRGNWHLEPYTIRTLILLLYGTGLRIGEAIRLQHRDVELNDAILTVRETKFYKTRLVPVSSDLTAVLRGYFERKWKGSGSSTTTPFLATYDGRPVTHLTAELAFKRIRYEAGVKRTDGFYYQPRLHDFRHTFAVRRLVTWYQERKNVQRLLPHLATYLGHVSIRETSRYLTMTKELLDEASHRFELYASPGGKQ